MSETKTEAVAAPEWQRARYSESEQMSLGCVVLRINRPIGTQGKPPEPLVIHVGETKLKRADIQDFPEARAYALATAEAFLARSLARCRAALSNPESE